MAPILVITTTESREQAERIASRLVARRLVAYAQISEIDSFFRWDGEVQHEPELRLRLKTTDQRFAEVEAAIRALHTYGVPAIYALPISLVHRPLAESTAGA